MGKSAKKSNDSKSTAPKCTCNDPYTCSCGNRPPRPSKGHKWYSETQEWAGKGHKQKGASGQVASVAAAAVTTSMGKTTLEAWQRLPSTLLDEYLRKQKRLKANYERVSTGKQDDKYRYRVILPDAKNSDKNLVFAPMQGVANQEQAREEAALLALLTLTPNMPHERKLPEPYKQTWMYAVEAQKKKTKPLQSSNESGKTTADEATTTNTSTTKPTTQQQSSSTTTTTVAAQVSTHLAAAATKLATEKERQVQLRRERNERIRHHEAVRLANLPHRVFMSAHVRRQIEALLRGEGVSRLLEEDDGNGEDSDDEDDANNPAMDVASRDLRAYVLQRLVQEGFSRKQARTAFTESTKIALTAFDEKDWDEMYEASLQWLLVHLPEDKLPEGFDPQEGMLDVITAKPKVEKSGEAASEVATRYSLTIDDAKYLLDKMDESGRPIQATYWNLIVAACNDHDYIQDRPSTDADATMNMELMESELEAVKSIYDSTCSIGRTASETTINLQIPDTKLTLEIAVANGSYPAVWPSHVVVSGSWELPRAVGVALHSELLKFLKQNLSLGDFMLLEILGKVQQLLPTCGELPSMSLKHGGTLQDSNNSSSAPVTQADVVTKAETTRSTNQRRPRERAKFWSVSPRETPPAVALPKISKLLESARASLPAAAARAEFLEKLDACSQTGNVMLVTGSTGCGKTTQICQFILEANPEDAKIVVAQPRRLAATGVAARVAEERGEDRPGLDSVGYVVRGDLAICDRTRLVFCTTGVLLRQLQNDSALDCLTHIIIDEVHERNLDSDILLGLLKQIKTSYPRLKIILMSATIDAERMAAYWGNQTPTMDIPGRTFPVTDYTLEDVFALTHTSDLAAIEDLCRQAKTLDYDLIGRLVRSLIESRDKTESGSILIFLPGAPEINKAIEAVKRRTVEMPVLLLPLHGGLQPKEQGTVFCPPPFGSTKVILSTNIAETSVTIPDCTVVIDSCREKQSSYDPANRMPLLVEQYASKASLKQRRGRSGRVQAGVCYKMISKEALEGLREHSEPEIRRCALEQTLLSLLYLEVEDGSGNFMQTLLDPPSDESLRAAEESLRSIGAVESDKAPRRIRLSSLGRHLAGIPAPPIIGKLLVMGSILGCRSAALGMAAGLSLSRSPLVNIVEPRALKSQLVEQEESTEATKARQIIKSRRELANKVGNSDHALLASIYTLWTSSRGEIGRRKKLCDTLGLSFPAMKEMEQLGNLLDSALSAIGFRASTEGDRNANSMRIIHACAVSAMSPGQLVRVVRPKATYDETAQGAKEKENDSKELKLFIRLPRDAAASCESSKEERVFIHPSSSNFSTGSYGCPWLVFFQLLRTSKPYLRDVTECSPYALLLFGGPLTVQASKDLILIDNWASLSANARIGSLVGGLRRQIDELLALKTTNVSMDIGSTDTMKLITSILKTDGIGGTQ